MYQRGQGVHRDYNESVRYYRKAAALNNSFGQLRLGSMYYYGLGVAQDYNETLKWARLAADQGDSSAQTMIGTR